MILLQRININAKTVGEKIIFRMDTRQTGNKKSNNFSNINKSFCKVSGIMNEHCTRSFKEINFYLILQTAKRCEISNNSIRKVYLSSQDQQLYPHNCTLSCTILCMIDKLYRNFQFVWIYVRFLTFFFLIDVSLVLHITEFYIFPAYRFVR